MDGLVGVVPLWAKNSVSLQQYFAYGISDVLKVTAIKQNAPHRRSQSWGSLALSTTQGVSCLSQKEIHVMMLSCLTVTRKEAEAVALKSTTGQQYHTENCVT